MRITQWLEERRQDVRFALRQLKSTPTFTVVAALTLALGIGANSAMFALADATLIRPLPYPDADRLVMVWERAPTFPRVPMAPATLLDLEEQTQSFDAAGGGQYGDRRRSLARSARRHPSERRPTVRDGAVSSTRSA